MKRTIRAGAALLSAATLVGTVVGSSGQAWANQNDKSTFSMFFNLGDGHGFDPDLFGWEMYLDTEGIFEGLVLPGGKNANHPRPGIATSWSVSKDGKTYTFKLRHNAKFSNGDPVTAQDFVYSMQRAVNANTMVGTGESSAIIASLPILNAQQIRQGVPGFKPSDLGVKAIDDTTLQIQLTRPDPTFIRDLTLPSSGWVVPVDPPVVNSMSAQDWQNPSKIVSDGPYMLTGYTLKTSATLAANPHYYGKVSFKTVDIYYNSTSSSDTSLPSFKSGQMDESMLQPQDLVAAKSDPSLSKDLHLFHSSAQYTYAVVPSQNRALQNANIREAFALAIDRNVITKDVLQGAGSPAYAYFLPTWLDPWAKKYASSYNPALAQKLLAKAGYPGGKGFPTVDIIVGSTSDNVATAIQQMWEKNLGVNVKFEGMEWGAYVNALTTQLPSNEVGFINVATNANYADLALPQSLASWFPGNTNLVNGFLSPKYFQAWNTFHNNAKLSQSQKMNAEISIYEKTLPKDVLNNLKLGIKAFNTNNQTLLRTYYGQQIQRNYQISVYTPNQPILLAQNVKGYQPNQMLLIDPPYWLNDISKS